MKVFKVLVKWLPMMAIALMGALAYQHTQAAKPSYEVDGANHLGRSPKMGLSQHYDRVKVLDGDTIELPTRQKVRFCGIDAPELAHGNKPGQPLGEESREKLRSLIAAGGGEVIVSPSEKDRYGRLVAEVFVPAKNPNQPEEEKLVNYEMVRSGMAYHYAQYSGRCPNGGDDLADAEKMAKSKRLGVWRGDYQKPWDYRKAQR